MLKFLLILISIFWLIPAFIRAVIRLFHMTELKDDPSASNTEREGNITIKDIHVKNKKVANKMGEYIDFIEKDKKGE